MTDLTKGPWNLVAKAKGGHSFWRHALGALAVADDSMRRRADPGSTDDGLLFVDVDEILKAGRVRLEEGTSGVACYYPLRNLRGERSNTGGNIMEAILLARILWGDDYAARVEIRTRSGHTFALVDGPEPKFAREA